MRVIEGQFWVGLLFFAVLLGFLLFTFYRATALTDDQRGILKLLSAFSAGFAGALIAGDVLFRMEGTLSNGAKYLLSGTSGFALFLVVFFFYPAVTKLPDGILFSVPEGWTLEHTAEALAKLDNFAVEFSGFHESELAAQLKTWNLKAASVADALSRLRSITKNRGVVRDYSVESLGSSYLLRIADGS